MYVCNNNFIIIIIIINAHRHTDTFIKELLYYYSMRTSINTTIETELKTMAISEGIAFNKALEFGIKFLIAEKDGLEYPENRLLKKMDTLRELLEKTSGELLNENSDFTTADKL